MSKPTWALQILNAEDLERQAHVLREESDGWRCRAEDSGGARCTADVKPEHAHCYDEKDLP
jgi:hypothetical protein